MGAMKHVAILVEEALAERRCRTCKWRAKEPHPYAHLHDKQWRECWSAQVDSLTRVADGVIYSPDFGCVSWEKAMGEDVAASIIEEPDDVLGDDGSKLPLKEAE